MVTVHSVVGAVVGGLDGVRCRGELLLNLESLWFVVIEPEEVSVSPASSSFINLCSLPPGVA